MTGPVLVSMRLRLSKNSGAVRRPVRRKHGPLGMEPSVRMARPPSRFQTDLSLLGLGLGAPYCGLAASGKTRASDRKAEERRSMAVLDGYQCTSGGAGQRRKVMS